MTAAERAECRGGASTQARRSMLTGLYLVGGLVLLGNGLEKYRKGRTLVGGLSMFFGAVVVAMVVDLWLGLSPLGDWVDDWFDERLN